MPDRQLNPFVSANQRLAPSGLQQALARGLRNAASPLEIPVSLSSTQPHLIKSAKVNYLEEGLRFLKFDQGTIDRILETVSTTATFAAGVGDVVSFVSTVKSLLEYFGLLEKPEDLLQRLDRFQGVIEHLFQEQEDQRQRLEASKWKVDCHLAGTALYDYFLTPSPQRADDLIEKTRDLDSALLAMLDAAKTIPFNEKRHWFYGKKWNERASRRRPLDNSVEFCVSGFNSASANLDNLRLDEYLVALNSSRRLDAPAEEGRVWDPSSYILFLIEGLRLRLLISTAIEPLYRSTSTFHSKLDKIGTDLALFATRWKDSLVIINPLAGMYPDKLNAVKWWLLSNEGLPIGAFDPVFGISSTVPFLGFETYYTINDVIGNVLDGRFPFDIGARGSNDTDPGYPLFITNRDQAIQTTLLQHGKAIQSVVKSTGASYLMELAGIYNKLAKPTSVSQVIDLTSAAAYWPKSTPMLVDPKPFESLGPVSIKMEQLAKYARDPAKVYAGDRYATKLGKTFMFNLARRATHSGVQLGFDLRIGDVKIGSKSWTLIPFSKHPPMGTSVDWFPEEVIEETVEFSSDVFDCVQDRHLSRKEEDTFEKEGSGWLTTGDLASRVFVNLRRGRLKFRIKITTESLPGSDHATYLGRAVVEILPLPDEAVDAAILDVRVMETILDVDGQELTREADRMTVHLIPSYIILGKEFFDDYRDAYQRMLGAVADLRRQFPLKDLWNHVPKKVDRDPLFNSAIVAQEIAIGLKILDLASQDTDMNRELGQFLVPR